MSSPLLCRPFSREQCQSLHICITGSDVRIINEVNAFLSEAAICRGSQVTGLTDPADAYCPKVILLSDFVLGFVFFLFVLESLS